MRLAHEQRKLFGPGLNVLSQQVVLRCLSGAWGQVALQSLEEAFVFAEGPAVQCMMRYRQAGSTAA